MDFGTHYCLVQTEKNTILPHPKGMLTSFNILNPNKIKVKITKKGMNNPPQNTAFKKIQCIFSTKETFLFGF